MKEKYDVVNFPTQLFMTVSINNLQNLSLQVYEVENEKRQRFAVKRVELEDVDDFIMQSYLNEINLLLKLKGEPSIIELYDW